ncbi:hypothetical protein VTN49DRAFT_867 [Thermomyces lanuginosus]|uniref:uncharacterized protein n=1 Tax=Thermomyces lanuginosus TaxID=5541 RepID=UPI003743F5F6
MYEDFAVTLFQNKLCGEADRIEKHMHDDEPFVAAALHSPPPADQERRSGEKRKITRRRPSHHQAFSLLTL